MAKKLFKMSDGSIRWYDDSNAPKNGTPMKADKPVEKKPEPEEKAIESPKNKAVTTAKTKVVKGSKK